MRQEQLSEAESKRMKELIAVISAANAAYYGSDTEIMPNHVYDRLVSELEELEERTGVHLDNSPVGSVGYTVVSELKKVKHRHPALSLDKTKSLDDLAAWMDGRPCVLAWKLDGLTLVLTYKDGKLISAVTRGDGIIGEDVTHNVKYIKGIPLELPDHNTIEVRGEVVISYKDFEAINDSLPVDQERYANPRNLAASSLRMLDSKKARRRHMRFAAFEWVDALSHNVTSYYASMNILQHAGFDVVERVIITTPAELFEAVRMFESHLEDGTMVIPSDGLVISYDDLDYAASLGSTGHHPRGMFAFKWQDDEVETKLIDMEWSASRTGLLNPVAVFEPVQLEGTTVQRASVHNISIFKNLELGIGDKIMVYKANKIIPQVADNLTRSGTCKIPKCCPVCGSSTEFRTLGDTAHSTTRSLFLFCTNPDCAAKHQGLFERMVSRDGLNIRGMGPAVIEQFVSCGWLKNYSDVFCLSDHRDEMIALDGFDTPSVDKLLRNIKNSRETTFQRFFYALGIPNCGHDVGKILDSAFSNAIPDLDSEVTKLSQFFEMAGAEDAVDRMLSLKGIGEVTARAVSNFYQTHKLEIADFAAFVFITDNRELSGLEDTSSEKDLSGMTFVITGKLDTYKSRNELKSEIEGRGGKVFGSVSKNTTYLINNDTESLSSKNKMAKELGVKIISEAEYKTL